VWHSHPHIEPTLNIPERIIEQYFVVTDVNVDGRYARKSSVEGRSQGG
jgi:hypothetical protein